MNKSVMKFLLVLFAVLIGFASSQDVKVPDDLLGTTTVKPNITTTEKFNETTTIFDVDYEEETTDIETEETTTEDDINWGEGTETPVDPPADSLIRPQIPIVPPIPLPPFDSNCTIQLPPFYFPSNQPPIIIPPIVNTTFDPVLREETLICPVGAIQVGSVCNVTYSNECPEGYTFNGERCVIKFTNCPLNFELNELGQCVQRQLCPHNHVWKNGRCEPITQCPSGWRWNGERCEVIRIECPPGSIYRDNECVSESFTCPIGFDQVGENCIHPKPLCPPGYQMKENGFCSQVSLRCQPGSVLVNNECQRKSLSCPPGTQSIGNQCFQVQTERPSCPPGFQLVGSMCNLIPTQRPVIPELNCLPGTVKVGQACYIYNGSWVITCPSGFYIADNRCIYIDAPLVSPPTEIEQKCPDGYYKSGNNCYPIPIQTPTPPRPIIPDCPSGSYWKVDRCVPHTPKGCQPGFYEVNGYCYPITTKAPPPDTTTPRIVLDPSIPPVVFPPATPRPIEPRCPDGFSYHNRKCYRCPQDFDLCENRCIKRGNGCQSNTPNININIFTKDNGGSSGSSGKFHNIINRIEPINNTIVNINNVTHPVTLNNIVENNIHIFMDAQCPDGSIRTIVVKNNETINGCLDMEGRDDSPKNQNEVEDDDEQSEKCCEVITPRQCKKREVNQWICSHRRYKYCGKFCIADRLYLKPPSTSFRNNILTIAPSQPIHNNPPCFGRNCPPVDCSGCINGSFNCSVQCYTYPCNHSGCHYLNEEDFCSIVGGQICEQER